VTTENPENNDRAVKLLDHEYDGIKELDHPLPGWWLATFYITILFGIPYFIYHIWAGAPTLKDEFNEQMGKINAVKAELAKAVDKFDQQFYQEQINAGAVAKGAILYQDNCVACHLEKGEGDIGPNLTDDTWIHVDGTTPQVYELIVKGVEENGMPVWSETLNKEELYQVSAYVMTLIGTNIPGKEPQGDIKTLRD